MRRLLAVSGAVVALGLAACGDDDRGGAGAEGGGSGGSPAAGTPTETVERQTRVEVVKRIGSGRGAFDPESIFERDGPGVVTITATGLRASPQSDEEGAGLGSGFVLNDRGEIATNAHVVTSGEGAEITRAKNVFVDFPDGNKVPARILGFDPFSDVALLKIEPRGLTLRPLPLGRTAGLKVGEPVAAIGSPFGERQSVSIGIISALDRTIGSLTGFDTSGAIQTDAAINQGNSGGPLLNAAGEVLGINSQIRTDSGAGSGVGFAVSVDTIRSSLSQIRDTGKVDYAYLGVSTTKVYPQLAERFDLPTQTGAFVQEVVDDGPADDAGLKAGGDPVTFQDQRVAPGGDVIVAVDGQKVRRETDLSTELAEKKAGDEVTLGIFRDGERREVEVTLGSRPLDTPRRP